MSVVFPPYSPGGGGGGSVASVNGDTGPDVVLDAADVGAIAKPGAAPGQQNRVPLFDATGALSGYANAVTTASQGAIPLRTTSGHIILPVSAPTNAAWAASKGYVDGINTALDARLDAIEAALPTFITSDGTVEEVVARTQVEFDAIVTKPATTHYLIDG